MKAILVIDVDNTEDYVVEVIKKRTSAQLARIVHTGLKLKPMPQKKEVEVNKIEDIMHTEYSIEDIYKNKYIADIRLATDKLIALGYNKCIEEITGEEE